MFDHIDEFEFFLNFWVQILSYLPLHQEGTAAEFPALGSSHNRPWLQGKIMLEPRLHRPIEIQTQLPVLHFLCYKQQEWRIMTFRTEWPLTSLTWQIPCLQNTNISSVVGEI